MNSIGPHRNCARTLIAALCVSAFAGAAFGQPSLSSVTPGTGPTSGGNILLLQGTGLQATATVLVGGRSATVLTSSGTAMYVLCPAGQGAAQLVQVIDQGMFSNTVAFTYEAPIVTSVSPNSGPTSGGTLITVHGKNFGLAPSVTVDGAVASQSATTHTQIVCTLPPGAGADREVVVTASGQSGSPGRFAYSPPVINSVNPSSLPTAGGVLITIQGANFGAASPQVLIDGKVASVQQATHAQLVVSAPPGEGSSVEVQVVAAGQASPPSSVSYQAPTILGILTPPGGSPTSGGVLLTIQGSNFGLAPSITVGGADAPIVGPSSHSVVVCSTPEGVGSNLPVTVRARDQSSNSLLMSYAPPVILSVSGGPTGSTLPSSGGTLLTITGENFGPTSGKLFVGGLSFTNVQHDPASPHTQITAVSPAGLGRGRPLMMIVGDQVAYFGSPLHFDMPVCAGDADGDGLVDFDDITSSIANWSAFCP